MYILESSNTDNLSKIVHNISQMSKDISKDKFNLFNCSVFNTSNNYEDNTQSSIIKFTSHEMDEKLDLFVFLQMILSLYNFEQSTLV